MPGTFVHAVRELNGVTAGTEKRVLLWIARRLPRWVNADHLTALAAVSMAGASASYALARFWLPGLLLVNVFLFLNWFGDSLDGTVARVRDEQRPRYGFYVDHVLDCAGITLLLIGMAASGLMSLPAALLFLAAYLLVSVEVFLATYCLASFRMSFLGVGPTELRILLAIGNLAAFVNPTVTIVNREWLLFDLGGTLGAAGLIVIFLSSAVRNGARLYAEEPRTVRAPRDSTP